MKEPSNTNSRLETARVGAAGRSDAPEGRRAEEARDPNYYPPVEQRMASDSAPLKLAGGFLLALVLVVLAELALHG